jgi:hypothetical protein
VSNSKTLAAIRLTGLRGLVRCGLAGFAGWRWTRLRVWQGLPPENALNLRQLLRHRVEKTQQQIS